MVAKRVKTAKLNDLDTVESMVSEQGEEADVKSAPTGDTTKKKEVFNTPVIVPSKGERSYTGPATNLMNELYDAGVPAMETLPGWERITNIMARACEKLEKSGWKRGKRQTSHETDSKGE